jgi:hypothetical protein
MIGFAWMYLSDSEDGELWDTFSESAATAGAD